MHHWWHAGIHLYQRVLRGSFVTKYLHHLKNKSLVQKTLSKDKPKRVHMWSQMFRDRQMLYSFCCLVFRSRKQSQHEDMKILRWIVYLRSSLSRRLLSSGVPWTICLTLMTLVYCDVKTLQLTSGKKHFQETALFETSRLLLRWTY